MIGVLSNPFHSDYMQTGTLANSERQMQYVAFYQGMHCLL